MCQHDRRGEPARAADDSLETLVRRAAGGGHLPGRPPTPPADAGAEAAQGSRRRRLWEFEVHAHCPVIGVCLPIAALRRVAAKVLGDRHFADDYELHCGVIAQCRQRSTAAEAVQRELDRRCAGALRQAAAAKTPEALAAWWQATQGHDLAGALWATLTHARCTATLEHQVLGEVHMLQHQVGIARRVDLQRFEALSESHAQLERRFTVMQTRATRQAAAQHRRAEAQDALVVQLRAELLGRDTLVATLREDLRALEAAVPGLKSRQELARETERLVGINQLLQRSLMQAQQEAERQRERALAAEMTTEKALRRAAPPAEAGARLPALRPAELAPLPGLDGAGALPMARDTPAVLDDQAVLCVGGRRASVPIYRLLVERTGGRFLHHDGGEQDNPAKLDATLAAADLVICQTGCISHDAYWRVKDHCKRTGKRCVFVENPSSAGMRRALRTLAPEAQAQAKLADLAPPAELAD